MTRILSSHELPIVDLGNYRASGTQHQALLQQMEKSLHDLGFLVVDNHGVDLALLARCYDQGARYFALPPESKQAQDYRTIDQKRYSNIGYFPFQEERAVAARLPDLKEFFHVGPQVPEALRDDYAENRWPEQPAGFQADAETIYRQFIECGRRLFLALAELFSLDMDEAHSLIENSNSILRFLHYPPVPEGSEPDAMRAAPHTGIQLLGLQPETSHAGLQFHLPTGEWVALAREAQSGRLTINIGEMFAYLTGGRVKPTLHRVVNAMDGSEHEHRYAIVFFFHAGHLRMMKSPTTGESIRAGDWLLQRLQDLDLKIARKAL